MSNVCIKMISGCIRPKKKIDRGGLDGAMGGLKIWYYDEWFHERIDRQISAQEVAKRRRERHGDLWIIQDVTFRTTCTMARVWKICRNSSNHNRRAAFNWNLSIVWWNGNELAVYVQWFLHGAQQLHVTFWLLSFRYNCQNYYRVLFLSGEYLKCLRVVWKILNIW